MGSQLGSLAVAGPRCMSMHSLPGRGEEEKRHWHGRESLMGTKREDFMIILTDKKPERSKNLIIFWGKCDGFLTCFLLVVLPSQEMKILSWHPIILSL